MIIGGNIELFWKLKNLLRRWKIKQSWFIPTVLVEQDWKRYGVCVLFSTFVQMVFFCKIIISWKRKTQCSNKPHVQTNPHLPYNIIYCSFLIIELNFKLPVRKSTTAPYFRAQKCLPREFELGLPVLGLAENCAYVVKYVWCENYCIFFKQDK